VRKGKQVLTMARKMKQHASGSQEASEQNHGAAGENQESMVSSYGDPCNERVTG
jgi:hypothetical protein